MEHSEVLTFYLSGSSEQACIETMFQTRWPNGFQCPHCHSQNAYEIRTRRLPLYECSSCGIQTSLIAGTIMEGSRTPIRIWFLAMFLHSCPEGITTVKLTDIIGSTYKTAWLIYHKIRHAMTHSTKDELLSGLVHINFSQYGRPYNPTIYRHPQEQPLLIGASMDEQGLLTSIKIKQAVEECSYPQFTCPLDKIPFIRKHVDPQATEIIAVTLKYSKDRNRQLLQISKNACLWINITFNGIGAKHLQTYLDQFCYGYNMTLQKQSILPHLIKLCTSAPVLKYRELINKPNIQPKLRSQYTAYLKNAG